MKLEYPQFLFAFFLLLIPIIIHLFNFRKYKTINFSSLFFIKQINEETKSTQKLKHLLVLFSRIFAFTALIFAFAQPYKPVKSNVSGSYPFVGIYIDNSFSMSMIGTEGELLSMAKEKAKSIVKNAKNETRFMLVTNDFYGFEQRLTTKVDALERIDKIESSPLNRSIDEIINWMKEGLSEEIIENNSLSSKQLILLSDFQKVTSNFEKIKADTSMFYYPIQLTPQVNSNVSIDSIWFTEPNFKIGVNNELNVKIKNHSDVDLVNAELSLEVNQTKRDVFVDLKSNSSETIKINYSDQNQGLKRGTVKINDKQIHFDDEFYFSYEVKEKSNILIIDGEQAVQNVSIVYNLDKYYAVNSVKQNSFTGKDLNQKDLIILNGINEISTATQDVLLNFNKEGGTIAIFPGEKLNFESINSFLTKLKAPTFSGVLTEGTKIQRIAYEDPFFQGMFEKKPENLNLPSISKAYKISRKSTYDLISMQNSLPLFLKTNLTNSVYLFASSLSSNFGNFTSNALFSSILLRVAETSQRRYPLFLTIGTDSKFPIYNLPISEEPLKLKSEKLEFIPQILSMNDLTYISINKNTVNSSLLAGFYEIIKNKTIAYVALNYKRDESDVKTLSMNDIQTGFSAKGIKNVQVSNFSNESDSALIKLEKPKEYWKIFIILALLFLLIEMSLLKWIK